MNLCMMLTIDNRCFCKQKWTAFKAVHFLFDSDLKDIKP